MAKDLSGQQFGRLTVIEKAATKSKEGRAVWVCSCSCGNTVLVDTKSLTTQSTKSCGCYSKEVHKQIFTKHGESKSKLYFVWNDMKSRCTDKKALPYKDYGGRGIFVCEEWMKSYEPFRDWALSNGYKQGLTLDRKDVDKGYYPENCRWATMQVQCNNKRNNRIITYEKETHTISEWSKITGISKETIRYRLNAGWDVKDILTIKPIIGGNYGTK